MKKVILVDGNNLMFRSYYATAYTGALMKNSKGQATNALYGFTNMINKIIEEEKPSYMVVAFDVGKNFRHEKYTEYKAGRNETPDDLKSQMPLARTLLDAMGIKHLELEGFEADDIIGTLAKEASLDPEYDALIVSSDHDLLQLISSQVGMKMLKSKDAIYYTEESFKAEYGFEPIKIIDLKALMGDSSDNIPGVKGIGEKTAMGLIQKYGSLDGVYENIENIGGKLREKLEIDKNNAYFSFELATIFKDVPLDFKLSELTYDGIDEEKIRKIYQELEFHSFLKNMTNKTNEIVTKFTVVNELSDIKTTALELSYYIECDNENYHYANILGMSISDGANTYFIRRDLVGDVLNKFKNKLRYTHGLKKNTILAEKLGITLPNTDYDLMIAAYLLDGTNKDDIALKLIDSGINCYYYEELLKGKVADEDFTSGMAKKAKYIYDTKDDIIKSLKKEEMYALFSDIEIPLVQVLSSMESEGIKVDRNILKSMQEDLSKKIDELSSQIKDMAGEDFNISSPKQLGEILFNKMGIPYPGKKGTFSTDVATLEKIRTASPIIDAILEYRTLTKLYNTYVEPLEEFIKEDGKIHTIYKQTLTRTGRLSSVEPNLQNIPTREEEGRLIKKAFLAEDNSHLLSADYSQIELRILAHISGDETMINAFNHDEDIHKRVAADIYGKNIEEVTKSERSTAKSVIFGIVYGISGFGLGENLHISAKEAKKFIDKYYQLYPRVHEYMENIKKEAYDKGYVRTLFNRKRIIDELKSPVWTIRSGGERIALNTPIQGTGADIIKIAMIDLYRKLKNKNLKSKILLQVHDEIILNVYDDEKEIVESLVKNCMENVIEFSVPLKVEVSYGKDWYEAK